MNYITIFEVISLIKALIFDLGNTLVVEGHPLLLLKLFPDVRHVLQTLKEKYKLALITNVPPRITEEYIHDVLRQVGIFKFFDVITVSSEVGLNKPDEEIFTLTLEKLQVAPDEAFMIGNTIATDIFGGNRIGMTTVLVQRQKEYQLSTWEHPNHTIHSLKELLALIIR
jgi:putative hydrolase of the HAD superfamily